MSACDRHYLYNIHKWSNKNRRSTEGPKTDSSNGKRMRIKVLTTTRAHICKLNIPESLTLREVLDESFRNPPFFFNSLQLSSNIIYRIKDDWYKPNWFLISLNPH
jgi:hypothetical protein